MHTDITARVGVDFADYKKKKKNARVGGDFADYKKKKKVWT